MTPSGLLAPGISKARFLQTCRVTLLLAAFFSKREQLVQGLRSWGWTPSWVPAQTVRAPWEQLTLRKIPRETPGACFQGRGPTLPRPLTGSENGPQPAVLGGSWWQVGLGDL